MDIDKLLIPLAIILLYSLKGIAVLAIAYFGTRFALRHQRRTSK
jgi:hypothetical protein